jgi:hypothetical protein
MGDSQLVGRCSQHFAYPKVGQRDYGLFRVGGGWGLGNLLLPWARALVASRAHGLTLIRPTWLQFVKAPFLRGGDLRLYCGLFHRFEQEVAGLRRLFLLAGLPRYREADLVEGGLPHAPRGIVIFEGIEGFFESIVDDYALVRSQLIAMTRPRHLGGLRWDFRGSISVHVRRGDFSQPTDTSEIASGKCNMRIPLEWYVSVVKEIRCRLGRDVRVYVFSDGKERELTGLLEMPQVQRLTFGSSIADLIALSCAHLLVASGSTFSMWASYLGRMPVIWHAGQLKQRLYHDHPEAEQECQNAEELPDQFHQLSGTALDVG